MAHTQDISPRMDLWLTAVVILLALLLLGGMGLRMVPLFKVKVGEVTTVIQGQNFEIAFDICMPLYGPEPDRDDHRIRQAVRGQIYHTMQQHAPVKDAQYWRVNKLSLAGGHATGNRCQGIQATLQPRPKGLPPVADIEGVAELFEEGRILRMALREGLGHISHFSTQSGRWEGVIPDVGRALARNHSPQGKILFYGVKTVGGLLDAIRFGVADIAEGRISYTERRNGLVHFSSPYINTGIVMGSFEQQDAQKLVEKRNINNGRIKLVVTKNSTSADLARGRFPRAIIHYVNTTEGIPQKVHWLRAHFTNPLNRILFLTDEMVALGWQGAVQVVLNNTPLLTQDHYVIATWHPKIQQLVNTYLKKHPIKARYMQALRHR
ncbi:substrate-binding periplasmic protein [Magnetococcus sp. PR-3]|uniref:substrate-binding periplasmic protein n=1 Tax=Magnetococcus sp. PR-3 TaxID=3120355 RepID=UPI002FCE4BE7